MDTKLWMGRGKKYRKTDDHQGPGTWLVFVIRFYGKMGYLLSTITDSWGSFSVFEPPYVYYFEIITGRCNRDMFSSLEVSTMELNVASVSE